MIKNQRRWNDIKKWSQNLHVQSGNPKYPDLQTVHLSSMIFALQEHTPLSLQVVEVAPA